MQIILMICMSNALQHADYNDFFQRFFILWR